MAIISLLVGHIYRWNATAKFPHCKDILIQICIMKITIIIICIVHTLYGCRTSYQQHAPQGFKCRRSSDIFYNASKMAYPQCFWHCLRRHSCLMLMYNTNHHYSLLSDDFCKEAELDDDFIVTYLGPPHNGSIHWWKQTSHYNKSSTWDPPHNDSTSTLNQTNTSNRRSDCFEWRMNEDDMPENLVLVNDGVNDYAVARISVGNVLLPGAYRNGNTKTVLDGVRQSDLAGEYLLVYPGCSVDWVPWRTTSELPAGTKIGGHLADDIPLYVAKGLVAPGKMKIGYYKHQTTNGHFWSNAEIKLPEIFILVFTWTKITRNDRDSPAARKHHNAEGSALRPNSKV